MAEYKDVAAIKTKIQKICDNCWHPYRLGGCPEHCGINDALKAIDSVPPAQPEPEEFEWCHTCREYDQEKHCCHRWTKVIRQTVEDMKAAQPGWIPCKTRKPEKSGLYLVTKQQKTGEIQIATAHYNTAFDEWSGNGNFKKVLAWIQLPAPWKEDK